MFLADDMDMTDPHEYVYILVRTATSLSLLSQPWRGSRAKPSVFRPALQVSR